MRNTKGCQQLENTERRQEGGPASPILEPGRSHHRLDETLFPGSRQTTRTYRIFSDHTRRRCSIWFPVVRPQGIAGPRGRGRAGGPSASARTRTVSGSAGKNAGTVPQTLSLGVGGRAGKFEPKVF